MKGDKRMLKSFVNLYPVSKTLRFELKPQGKTMETIERDGLIETDQKRAEDYRTAKEILDMYYRHVIEQVLSTASVEHLEEYMEFYTKSHIQFDDKDFIKLRDTMRKELIKEFESQPFFKGLFKEEILSKLAKDYVKEKSGGEKYVEILDCFNKFSSYFTGFFENRKNVFSAEAKSTSLAYRIVEENLPIYIDNINAFKRIVTTIEPDLMQVQDGILHLTDFKELGEAFTLEGYNKVLSQSSIDAYQALIGGYVDADGKKIQGINEKVNLYNQTCKNKDEKLPCLKSLKKQILSDRTTISFVLDAIKDDQELLYVLKQFHNYLMGPQLQLVDQLEALKNYLGDSEGNNIFVDKSVLADLSNYATRDWKYANLALEEEYDKTIGKGKKITESYITKRTKELAKVSYCEISDIDQMTKAYVNEQGIELEECYKPMIGYFLYGIEDGLSNFGDVIAPMVNFISCENFDYSIRTHEEDIALIKKYLDVYMNILHLLKPLAETFNVNPKDENFYTQLAEIWDKLQVLNGVYNKVRNYITKKPYSQEKIKINFNCATLLNGWDKNKERDNLGVILLKNEKYYLAIMKAKDNKLFIDPPRALNLETSYKKMDYKLLPGPKKMLPKVFFSTKGKANFNPSAEIVDIYERGSFKKGESFSLSDCHKLIDFFKESIEAHEDWSKFNFKFKDTNQYEDISQFYKEVSEQGYKITYVDIDEDYVDSLVEEGRLFLFEIYCKDFSPNSTGKPNLHTLYWKALFDQRNLEDVVYKLNGEAEVFYRKSSLPLKITHHANEPIARKNPLSGPGQSLFPYDLIKDKRYVYDKFLFHVPLTINFKASEKRPVNLLVRQAIKENDNQHIIGIDRGERHLLYVVVIDSYGNIVEQRSLNVIEYSNDEQIVRVNYKELLERKEKENIASKRNWKSSNTIKELKNGYLSLAIKEITKLIEKYNAIVVLEDLNVGFKSSRSKVEKQVYQKFEKMLIDKLNLLVNKDYAIDANGGVLKPYQLSAPFESFKKMGKQTGVLFYVSPWNTSKIDPETGFVNLFRTKYESLHKSKAFISNFSDIFWKQSEEGVLELNFKFEYSNFKWSGYGLDKQWIVNTYGERIYNQRMKNSQGWESVTVNLSDRMSQLFKSYGLPTDEGSVKEVLMKVDDTSFFKEFMWIFTLMISLRNSVTGSEEDHILSPVLTGNGTHFDSRCGGDNVPESADANGAYNIARKGLILVNRIKETGDDELFKMPLSITNQEWLEFAQSKY